MVKNIIIFNNKTVVKIITYNVLIILYNIKIVISSEIDLKSYK